jgi:transcriptional regulator with XRE-family HTH domain
MPRRRKEPDPTALAFGKAVRQRRQAQERTLEDVAARIPAVSRSKDGKNHATAMDPKYLGELEAGWFSPSITTAKLIADALEVPLADLVLDL